MTQDQKSAEVDVIVRTYNSGKTIDACMKSIFSNIKSAKIIVVDHFSTDSTLEIVDHYPVTLIKENESLGLSTMLGINAAKSEYVLFVDSDVEIRRNDFLEKALLGLSDPSTGAIVGAGIGHPFLYGLPLGLTLFRREDLKKIDIPKWVQGSETYFIRKQLRENQLKVRYVSNAMVHRSTFRSVRTWPEWQGAQVRRASGLDLRELLYSVLVIFLMLTNSKSLRNFSYYPLFVAKFMRGYFHSEKWHSMDRSSV